MNKSSIKTGVSFEFLFDIGGLAHEVGGLFTGSIQAMKLLHPDKHAFFRKSQPYICLQNLKCFTEHLEVFSVPNFMQLSANLRTIGRVLVYALYGCDLL